MESDLCHVLFKIDFFFSFYALTGDEVVTVKTPAFAESVTEGDVRWEKGKCFSLRLNKGVPPFFEVILEFCNELHKFLNVEFEGESGLNVTTKM